MARSYKPRVTRRFKPQFGSIRFVPAREEPASLATKKVRVAGQDPLFKENMALLAGVSAEPGTYERVAKALVDRAWARYRRSMAGRTDALAAHGLNFNSVGERMG